MAIQALASRWQLAVRDLPQGVVVQMFQSFQFFLQRRWEIVSQRGDSFQQPLDEKLFQPLASRACSTLVTLECLI
jgi:hypothetical protein